MNRLNWTMLAALWVTSGCTLRQAFIQLSYPNTAPEGPVERETVRLTSAMLSPAFQLDYAAPSSVAGCLEAARPRRAELWSYGACVAGGAPADACRRRHAPGVRTLLADPDGPCGGLEPGDGPRVAHALLESAEQLAALDRALHGLDRAPGPDAPRLLAEGWDDAVRAATLLLRAEPALRPGGLPRAHRPALALSGGAANAAFTAGYLHATLSLREEALAAAPPSEADTLDVNTRLGGAVSASAGSLVALALDLYFSDPPTDDAAAARRALQTCLSTPDGASLPPRAVQQCALHHLERDFQEDEAALFCSERGLITQAAGVFGDRVNLVRVDPLMEHRVLPIVRDYGDLIATNGFVRVSTTVEFGQNLVMGLDERACTAADATLRTRCLASAVAASISQPSFLPPVGEVWAGLEDNAPLQGAWYDGGLRSGTPATEALARTRGPVLALNTHRAAGVPAAQFTTAADLVLRTVDSLIHQGRNREMDLAERDERVRATQIALLGLWLAEADAPPPQGPSAVPPPPDASAEPAPGRGLERYLDPEGVALARRLRLNQSAVAGPPPAPTTAQPGPQRAELLRVFVPDDPERRFPMDAAAAGYAFDPRVTLALFLWGERAALRQWAVVAADLGWLDAWATSSAAASIEAALATRLAAERARVESELDAHLAEAFPQMDASKAERDAHAAAAATERRAVLRRTLPRCDRRRSWSDP